MYNRQRRAISMRHKTTARVKRASKLDESETKTQNASVYKGKNTLLSNGPERPNKLPRKTKAIQKPKTRTFARVISTQMSTAQTQTKKGISEKESRSCTGVKHLPARRAAHS